MKSNENSGKHYSYFRYVSVYRTNNCPGVLSQIFKYMYNLCWPCGKSKTSNTPTICGYGRVWRGFSHPAPIFFSHMWSVWSKVFEIVCSLHNSEISETQDHAKYRKCDTIKMKKYKKYTGTRKMQNLSVYMQLQILGGASLVSSTIDTLLWFYQLYYNQL